MAKVRIKGSKVIGTKKKDKIVWQSSSDWKKTLTVKAKAGNDIIKFIKSPFKKNKLYGEAGNDKIYGSMNADYIYGGDGNDIILGNSGNDRIYAGAGMDLIDGGSGKDKIWGDSGANAISGGSDNDTIYGGTGFDAIAGGKGNDVISLKAFAESSDTMTIKLNSALSKIFGGKTSITLTKDKRAIIDGGSGNDKISNIYGGAYVDGGKGSDTITAVSGNNTLYGGSGDDSITAGTGDDYIDGGSTNDTIIATAGGNNTIKGGSGNDSIKCGSGDDVIYGGQQNDTINAGGGNNTIYYGSGEGSDVIISGGGNDTVVFTGNSNISSGGFSGNDLLIKIGVNPATQKYLTLKDFKSGNHSVKTLVIDGASHSITEFVPMDASRPSYNVNAVNADVAAWQKDNSGYGDIAPVVGSGEADPIAALTTVNELPNVNG